MCPQTSLFSAGFQHFSISFWILIKYVIPNYPAQVLDVSFPNSQTRLRDMGQTGQEGQVTNLDLPMSIFFHTWNIKGVCHAHILSKNKN